MSEPEITATPLPDRAPELHSPDGRLTLSHDRVRVHSQTFLLLELERAELQPVRWLLWYLLGGFVFTLVALGYLQFWLRTMPAVLGLVLGAVLFIIGQRGTNRLRLYRLAREAAYFSLPGAAESWHPIIAELNRRIQARHDEAAQAAAEAWAAEEAARLAALPPSPPEGE
ncbi:hypothetical protein FY528_13830 [Hymenobacter lutimineralis]|uniref:Uncharacterized protein n=1 Tax=Hymenobacter lutimineralis TaxID=2606448 RepID=A0A5D6UYS8_9BACT|nr:hypothetical protein [Hymenobacter lutimineralis]TYZ08117.1 hypothetical protein FY528_13830 [Hymenobacter lutimineralis]